LKPILVIDGADMTKVIKKTATPANNQSEEHQRYILNR
jgi:hypothetical protein